MDSDSSSESDDEFLTVGQGRGNGSVDREALIRKKLLESFYGQSPGGEGGTTASTATASTTTTTATATTHKQPPSTPRNAADAKDLDSPYFDAAAHTSYHVVGSSVHKLLEMDEQLTLSVRTLDSQTQNMVYENYSKFIDATEAVKSVGVNVQANEQGLNRLQRGMETINEQSRLVEEDLGSLRDAVAEKIRTKRLLTRLDALLKLPETLRQQIAAGKYRTAASSFCRSTTILRKHSAGFESLQKIEAECNGILVEMIQDLNRKIRSWSGQETFLTTDAESQSTSDDENTNQQEERGEDFQMPPDPPASISEIFECAGTLALLGSQQLKLDAGVSVESCMSMSLAASSRYLDRLFDIHQLEIQEALLNPTKPTAVVEDAAFEGDHSALSQQSQQRGQHLVPSQVVDAILETATLFRMSFDDSGTRSSPQNTSDDADHLEEFIKDAFSSFLIHVRSVLLDYSFGLQPESTVDEDDQDGDADESYEEVAGAMSILLHAVRELASGLSLPEVGINADLSADLVEQASDLTETLVRRRVDQKFCDLRLRVVNDCLVPFATRSVQAEEQEGEAPTDERTRMLQVVQIAVSDCLQLLDDTVRSIVSGREVFGASAASVELPMLKLSIQASTGRFASWLAGTLEKLAGCDTCDPNFSFEASAEKLADADGTGTEGAEDDEMASMDVGQNEFNEMSNQYDDALAEKVDSVIQDLMSGLSSKGEAFDPLDFALKVCEMCRGCERAFVDSMNQSIESNVGGGKKGRSSGLFDEKRGKSVVLSVHERKTTGRFQLASSRILTLYATNRGFEAASALCATLCSYAAIQSDPDGPSSAVCGVLENAKQCTADCAHLFSDDKHVGPLPTFSEAAASQPLLGINASPLKGLQLDVERMFQEKVSIFPHPSENIDFSRDAMLTVLFKVVIKAIAEQTRQCSFSADGYNHLLIDVELLRGMASHYVNQKYEADKSNAVSSFSILLTEVMNSAGERCEADYCVGNEELVREALSTLSEFMKSDSRAFGFIMMEDGG